MSFLKKIIDKISKNNNSKNDEYRKELDELGLKTLFDLENLLKPLITNATKLVVLKPSSPPDNSQLNSHFGGQPYFEKGEVWPTTKKGKHLEFIFQVFNASNLQLPKDIALIQFYYDWNEFPWDTSNDGWLVKIYKNLQEENREHIKQPIEFEKSPYCDITFEPIKSLPNWEEIDLYSSHISKLSCILDEDESIDSYEQAVANLLGEQNSVSQLGGYPFWVQGETNPVNSEGNPMNLLFQLDSEDNAGLMWGDDGLVYVFYDEKSEKIEFNLQCY